MHCALQENAAARAGFRLLPKRLLSIAFLDLSSFFFSLFIWNGSVLSDVKAIIVNFWGTLTFCFSGGCLWLSSPLQ